MPFIVFLLLSPIPYLPFPLSLPLAQRMVVALLTDLAILHSKYENQVENITAKH
jgi:hypothetical protein